MELLVRGLHRFRMREFFLEGLSEEGESFFGVVGFEQFLFTLRISEEGSGYDIGEHVGIV